MKRIVLILILSISLVGMINSFAKWRRNGGRTCHDVEATRERAGRILDWCDDVTCRECLDYSTPGVIIRSTECWANC